MNLAAQALVLCVLLLCAGVLGYSFRGDRNQAAIATAQANEAVCQSALKGNAAALVDVKASLAGLRARHDAVLNDADTALDARDAEIRRLEAEAKARTTTIKETAHADADCAALARLPVCSAVAGQLWPVPREAAGTDRHAH